VGEAGSEVDRLLGALLLVDVDAIQRSVKEVIAVGRR
jgi:hypothetical protein